METVIIECRCGYCRHWKKIKYLKHEGYCVLQVDEEEVPLPKKDTDFCNYATKHN